MDILIIMEAKDYGYEEDDGGGGMLSLFQN